MANTPVLNFQDFIAADGDILTTTSQHIAAVFGKPHSDVLKRVRSVAAALDGQRQGYFSLTFHEVAGPNGATRQEVSYRIMRDGFTLLAMGFTGKKALAFKLAYIDAFNAMDSYIKNQCNGLTYRCLKNEMESKDSASRGSFHGRGLNQRKHEKPVLEAEAALLLSLIQPTLIN